MNTTITHSNFPEYLELLFRKVDQIQEIVSALPTDPTAATAPKYVNIKEAARLTGKTANALRVQVSLKKLTSIKKGNRHYFEREYLERWITGEDEKEKGASK